MRDGVKKEPLIVRALVIGSAACFLLRWGLVAGGPLPMDDNVVKCKKVQPIAQFPAKLATVLGIEIGEDSVRSVQHKLGATKLIRVSESDGMKMCYRLTAEGHTAYVAFEFGPLGGFNYVTAYSVSRSLKETEGECLPLTRERGFEPVKGLRLGITVGQFREAIGPGACDWKNAVEYSYEGKRRMTFEEQARFGERDPGVAENPFFDISAGIQARFDRTGLTEFYVYKTESD
jgi:hypothetical protein